MEVKATDKYIRARERVKEIKGFYVHAGIYIVINLLILVILFMDSQQEGKSFWVLANFFTLIFWGMGLIFHALQVFKRNLLFGRSWEERMIRKFMKEDEDNTKIN